MNSLYRDAILKASEVRRQLKVSMFQPINIFDSCINLGVNVKFVDVDMEGFYVRKGAISTILISNKRPFPRRCFTTAHELGHHVFNHGLKLDILTEERDNSQFKDKDEILADAFAGALLMPIGGVQAEFAKRGWDIQNASPINFYAISSVFGVGYSTLITHCKVNDLIEEDKRDTLLKFTPGKIFEAFFPDITNNKSYFRIIDRYAELSVVDIEVSNYLVLPLGIQPSSGYLEKVLNSEIGSVYVARKPGICPAQSSDGKNDYFIRIQRPNYIGFAEYRHLEN